MTQTSLFPEPLRAWAQIDSQIGWLMIGNRGGPLSLTLGDDEKLVLRYLRCRRGLKDAMPIRELQQRTNLSVRAIKDVVRTLRMNFHLPIGSSKNGADGGYYVIVSQEDLAAFVKDFTDQIRAQAAVLRAVAGSSAIQELLGQLQLAVSQ